MKFMYFTTLLLLGSFIPLSGQQTTSTFLYFDVDGHSLTNDSKAVLDGLYAELEQHSDYDIRIIGHTDQDGSDSYNENLAKRRTNSVQEYLTVVGYPTQKLKADWRGEQELLFLDASADSKQKNRRVEVISQSWDFEDVDELITSVAEDNPIQTFTCDNQSQFFDLQNGTSVFIPADAFQFSNGELPQGKIHLELVEAFRYTDMFSNNLVTQCKGNLLETGGMVYISATADGKELELIEDKRVEFIFPVQQQEEGMELFYGEEEEGVITWNDTGEAMRTTQVKNDPLDVDFTPIIEYDFGIIEKPTIVFDEMPRRPRRLNKPFPPSKHTYQGEKYDEMYASYESNLKAYNEQLPKLAKAEKAWQEEVTSRVNAIEDFKKQITEFQYSRKLYSAVRGLKQMEKRRAPVELLTSLFSFMNKPYIVKLDQRITFKKAFGNYTRDIVEERNLEVLQKEHMTRVSKNYYPDLKALVFDAHRLAKEEEFARTGRINRNDFSSYVMGISELGWINCDRFRNAEQVTKLTVMEGHSDTKYYMIFKDIRSIIQAKLRPGEGVFVGVPVGEDVKLVAIKLVDEKPYMAIQDHTIGVEDEVSMQFSPSSLKQIREELNSLDPMFNKEEKVEKPETTITMFPNPASIDFSLQVDSESDLQTIEVYDLSGALVKSIDSSSTENQTERVSVSDMDSGVYVVNARFSDGEMTSERIVVQR